MNRNTNAHFAQLPSVDVQRSSFDRSHSHKTSGNVGDIIPIFVDADIMPGDTVSMDTSKLIRFQTLLTPMMDNIQCDIYWFFVPHRLVWDHWINFMGENTDSAWTPDVEYTVPKIRVPSAGQSAVTSMNKSGTILDYMGFPVGTTQYPVDINALPIRSYAKVFNDWFRSENLTDPVNIYTGDATQVAAFETDSDTGDVVYNYIHDVPLGGFPAKAAKYADYFTSCLPSPQKGDAVSIMLSGSSDFLPVYTTQNNVYAQSVGSTPPQFHSLVSLNSIDDDSRYAQMFRQTAGSNTSGTGQGVERSFDEALAATASNGTLAPANLWADASKFVGSFTVNDMRYAFQLQKLLERDARGGTRYIEVIRSHFGVISPDARLQRPEYLGGNRFSIVIDQVANQAQSEQDFLGDLGAFSVTSDVHSDFTHSFTEHGTLLGLMVCRYDHTYSQGLHRMWWRDDRFSYYWPVFANIGEQPVYRDEICLKETSVSPVGPDRDVFGYNEAWAEYRFFPNRVSAEMRPYVQNGLFSWTLADSYSEQPTLSDEWLREDKSNVDRVLAVTSEVSNQFWADIYFSAKYTRPMPVYSVPGLIDHH